MGYKQEEKVQVLKVLTDSQNHQGLADSFMKDYEFAKYSYPLIAISLSVFKKLYPDNLNEGGIAVNVGS